MRFINLVNFKCFKDISIPLNQYTAFLGMNGIGKSSAIQAILMLKNATMGTHPIGSVIPLNGLYEMNLGTFNDIINQDENDGVIRISYYEENVCRATVSLVENEIQQLGASINTLDKHRIDHSLKYLYYLSAERIGPRVSQPIKQMNYLNVGTKGEYTAQVIDTHGGRKKVRAESMFPETKNPMLPAQVNSWLNFILPGVEIVAKTDYPALNASIRIANPFIDSSYVLPTNIGFGISYVLPIIVTGLIAKEGSMMIVENPEAHLHPAAQSSMGEFLGMVAKSGVNVLVETHSDHIVSGMQIFAAKHPEFSDKITIDNFSIDEASNQPRVDMIGLSSKGEITHWPNGFLDQAQKDYIKLSNISLSDR